MQEQLKDERERYKEERERNNEVKEPKKWQKKCDELLEDHSKNQVSSFSFWIWSCRFLKNVRAELESQQSIIMIANRIVFCIYVSGNSKKYLVLEDFEENLK